MKFKFIISKWGNFAFLIENFVNPFNYKQEIIKQFGQFNPKEENALKQYNKLIEKIQQVKRNKPFSSFYSVFFEEKDVSLFNLKQKVKKVLPKPLYEIWENVWLILTPRLEKIWQKYSSLLQYNKKVLQQFYRKNKKQIVNFVNDLSILFGNNARFKTINIFLAIMPLNKYHQRGFSIPTKTIKEDITIIISCGKLNNARKEKSIWPLILHEISHRLIDNKNYQIMIRDFDSRPPFPFIKDKDNLRFQNDIKKNLRLGSPIPNKTKDILKEVVISSLIRNLYLYQQKPISLTALDNNFLIQTSKKLAQLSKKKQYQIIYDFNFLKQYTAFKIYDLQYNYLVQRKPIDKNFLEEIYYNLFDYPQNLLKELEQIKKAIR